MKAKGRGTVDRSGSPLTRSVSFTVTEEQHAALHAEATKRKITVSECLRERLVASYGRKKKRVRRQEPQAHFVYSIVDHVDGTLYFGRTSNPARRWQSHLKCAGDVDNVHPLYVAMRRNGTGAFSFKVLYVFLTKDESKEAEGKLIIRARERGLRCFNLGSAANGHVWQWQLNQAKERLRGHLDELLTGEGT